MIKNFKIILLCTIFVLGSLTLKAPILPLEAHINKQLWYDNYVKQEKQNKEINKFLFQLSLRESSHRWDIVNESGYIGKYQFGKSALKSIGYEHVDIKLFKINPYIFPEREQDIAIKILFDRNEKLLKREIILYNGHTIKGIYITKSGLLAAAHLSGYKNVRIFLESNGKHNPKDKNGTTLTDYLKDFSGYDI